MLNETINRATKRVTTEPRAANSARRPIPQPTRQPVPQPAPRPAPQTTPQPARLRRAPKVKQLLFFPRGGERRGAGRKRKAPRPRVSHRTRPKLSRHHPVAITVRLRDGLPTLRRKGTFDMLQDRFRAGSDRFGFRLTHFSVQSNHLHLIAEAKHEESLSKGMQGLLVRLARGLNKEWQRKGRVFDDRYFARALTTPAEVRNALVYVLANAKKHGQFGAECDPFATWRWFDGWENPPRFVEEVGTGRAPPVVPAQTWLLRVGWRRWGLIHVTEAPALERA